MLNSHENKDVDSNLIDLCTFVVPQKNLPGVV